MCNIYIHIIYSIYIYFYVYTVYIVCIYIYTHYVYIYSIYISVLKTSTSLVFPVKLLPKENGWAHQTVMSFASKREGLTWRFPRMGCTPKWLVYSRKSYKHGWSRGPPFQETSTWSIPRFGTNSGRVGSDIFGRERHRSHTKRKLLGSTRPQMTAAFKWRLKLRKEHERTTLSDILEKTQCRLHLERNSPQRSNQLCGW